MAERHRDRAMAQEIAHGIEWHAELREARGESGGADHAPPGEIPGAELRTNQDNDGMTFR